jgi:glycosyltransferase involved in cell wall biosynthesis
MQLEELPCVLTLSGKPIASETLPGGAVIRPHSIRCLWDILWWRAIRREGWEGPQGVEVGRRLRRNGIEVVLANYGHCGALLAPVCEQLGIRLVVHFHGYDAHLSSLTRDLAERYRILGRSCARAIVVSERMWDALLDLWFTADNIVLVRCGDDPKQFKQREVVPHVPIFFGVGRFVDKKAPYLTVMAFHRVARRHPNARLVLAGDGPLLETARNVAGALGLDDSVEFPGILSPDEVAGWMRRATAFVQHSVTPRVGPNAGDSEGTPVAMLEAMMTGLPVIATRHAGLGEVIEHGVSGLLVDERDVEGMAAAMARVIESPAEAGRMGVAARRHALDHHTSSHYIKQLGDVLGLSETRAAAHG